ncbi:MAG: iron uptake transporter deferrochelatase/peroxidase subunit [Nocardioidaceae bacterium]
MTQQDDDQAPAGSTSRRGFMAAAVGTAGLIAGGAAGYGVARADDGAGSDDSGFDHESQFSAVPFYGKHQAGIATSAQDRLAFAAFDLGDGVSVDAVRTLMAQWAAAGAQLTQGKPVGAVEISPAAPPIDTGEAFGLPASNLTITVGFGPTFFDKLGLGRFKPAALRPIPALPPADRLDPAISNGDIGVQACANDPQVAFHVIRNFARIARGTAVMRWSQLGFGKTASTSTHQATPRNLMGFKDGTNNIKLESTQELDDFVWVGDETDQKWMIGGSYLVTRRIRMLIESWDTDFLADQEAVFGRVKDTGAPLTGKKEFDAPDLTAKDDEGNLVIDANAHIRLAAPATNDGQMILRRGYSYTDGNDPRTGYLDAGLFFICFQKNAHKQFVPIQRRLGLNDLLNEYILHTSSALFAVPPGLRAAGDYYGKAILG